MSSRSGLILNLFFFKKKYLCIYLHRSKDLLSPVCRILFTRIVKSNHNCCQSFNLHGGFLFHMYYTSKFSIFQQSLTDFKYISLLKNI